MSNTTYKRQHAIEALNVMGDWINAHPDFIPDSFHIDPFNNKHTIKVYSLDEEEFRSARRAMGGGRKVAPNDSAPLRIRQELDNLTVEVWAPSGTCEKVQVGTEAKNVKKVVREAEYVEVTEDVPVYEWHCPDSLLADEAELETEKVDA